MPVFIWILFWTHGNWKVRWGIHCIVTCLQVFITLFIFANIIALLCINCQILCLWIHRYEFFWEGRVWLFLYLAFFLDRSIEPLNWFFRGQGFRLFLLILLSKHSKHNYQDFLFPAIRFMPINNFASAGNRTRIYCLESNNANHYTTNALMTWH